jgi:hypothetical protein
VKKIKRRESQKEREREREREALPLLRPSISMDWLTLLVPFAYLGILLTSLATFSSLYRKRKARSLHFS